MFTLPLRVAASVLAAAALALAVGAAVPEPPSVPPADPPVETGPPPPTEPPATQPAPEPEPEQRVIIRKDRFTRVPGFVVLEDETVIVIRTVEDDSLRSFAKDRIAGIARLVDPKPDQPGIVVLESGETRSGIIISDTFEKVTVEIAGVRTTIRRDAVLAVRLEPTFEERYARIKASLTPERIEAHIDLCRWLMNERKYDLAKEELAIVLAIRRHPDAVQMMKVVDAHLALREDREADRPRLSPSEARAARTPEALLTEAEVNLIRVYEIDFDRPPRVRVPRKTVEGLIEDYRSHTLMPETAQGRDRLFRADDIDLVAFIFELRARERYAEIEVASEPAALNLFRQRVHDTWLMNDCSTSQCHGGPYAGRFQLERRRLKTAGVRYANLLTLERQTFEPKWPLINYERPIDSLLIQYGLPRALARQPHPPAEGWTATFRGPDDRRVRTAIRWIRGMLQPRPEYPIEFIPLGDRSPDRPKP